MRLSMMIETRTIMMLTMMMMTILMMKMILSQMTSNDDYYVIMFNHIH